MDAPGLIEKLKSFWPNGAFSVNVGGLRWVKREPAVDHVVLQAGSDLQLTCKAAGKPRPSVRWMKNGHPLNERFTDEPVRRSVLLFSRPGSEGWPHRGCTFSIFLCPLSF